MRIDSWSVAPVDSEKAECYRRANLRGSPQKAESDRNLQTVLNNQVLVLNRLWQAVNICSARSAFELVYAGHANIVSSDEANNFMTLTFGTWRNLSANALDHELFH